MLSVPTPPEEWRRLSALRALGVLDTDPDPELDAITSFAADLFEVPIALISLVDEERQWFKSKVGLDISETHRDLAFCGYTILSDDNLVVLDTHRDKRFCDHPLVAGEPNVRFYAAAPLTLAGGERVGTLCIISPEPRSEFSSRDERALRTLARQVVTFFENRRTLSEQRIARLVADTATDAFVAADPDGAVIYWNRGAEALFGYTTEEALGSPLDIIVPPEHRGAHLAGMKRLRDGGTPRLVGKTIEIPTVRKDGSRVMVELTLGMWSEPSSDRPSGFASIMRDVSQRKMTEKKLADQIAAIEAADEAIAILSPDGISQYMNRAYLDLFGLPENAADVPWSHVTAAHERERVMSDAFTAVREVGKWTGEVQGLSSSGKFIDCELSLTRAERSVVAVVRDISQRREAIREQARMREQLLLLQRREVAGQVAAGLAHDFNNLIAAISGSAALLERSEDAEARRHAQRISLAARDATDLVARLMQTGKRQTDYQVQDLRQIVEDAAALIRPSLGRDQQLKLELADEPVEAMVDRAETLQVVLNLMLNARDAAIDNDCPDISVELDYCQPDSSLTAEVGTVPSERCARLCVRDEGIGMEPHMLASIFDPFVSMRPGGGTGMGLAMSANIVAANGGAIAVESRPGEGSCFSVYWPLTPPDQEATRTLHLHGSQASSLRGKTVLLVDDKPAVVDTLAALLEDAGAEVGPCTSGEDALAALAEDPEAWSLLITDFDMPGLNGAELAMRAREIVPDLPMMLISALADSPRVLGQCRSLFSTICSKTASPSEIVALASDAIASGGDR